MLAHGLMETDVPHDLSLTHFPAVCEIVIAHKHQTSFSLKTLFEQHSTFMCVSAFVTDSREETVLGSIPLPSYVIAPVEPEDHINRKYAFKVTQKRI